MAARSRTSSSQHCATLLPQRAGLAWAKTTEAPAARARTAVQNCMVTMYCLFCADVWLCDVVGSEQNVEDEDLGHAHLDSRTYSLLFEVHRQQLIPELALETRQEAAKIT